MDGTAPRGGKTALLVAVALAGLVLFTMLGFWQIERRAWKLALIASVDARIHAAPVPAPPPARWPAITAARDQYRRVTVTGRFLNDRETLVQAVTDLGQGYWVMTPLRADDGSVILVDRGFVPEGRDGRWSHPAGPVRIAGLLRIDEPGGRFLRPNRPADGRFYSRDLAAIARVRGLGTVAPFFIDADAAPGPDGWPRGGLTVIRFPNTHLLYALTWFGLAVLCGWALVAVRRERA